jgi:hypothetical protein
MSNLRIFPDKGSYSDLNHESGAQAPEMPDIEKLQRLLGEMIGHTLGAIRKPERDREIRIRNFRSARFRLTEDLIVALEVRGDQYVANSYDTGQYGIGSSPDSAIQDLCSILEDYYDLLTEDKEALSDHLSAHLRYLDLILQATE